MQISQHSLETVWMSSSLPSDLRSSLLRHVQVLELKEIIFSSLHDFASARLVNMRHTGLPFLPARPLSCNNNVHVVPHKQQCVSVHNTCMPKIITCRWMNMHVLCTCKSVLYTGSYTYLIIEGDCVWESINNDY